MKYRNRTRHASYIAAAFGLAALALVVVLAGEGDRAQAANFVVTKTADTADGACNGDCSLREAIIAANANGVGSFDTITVPAGTYAFGIGGSDTGFHNTAIGDLDITNGLLTIDGAGPGATVINGNALDRIFDVKISTNLTTIRDLSIYNGNSGSNPGGGMTVGNAAVVSLINVAIDDNDSALNGGGIYNAGNLTIDHSTIRNNFAAGFGGGIQNGTLGVGSLSLANSAIHNNMAGGLYGGGLNNEYQAGLTNVTVSDNMAVAGNSSGGGIRHLATSAAGVTLTMVNVTISNNSATTGGGIRRTTNGNDPIIVNSILSSNAGGNCATSNGGIGSYGNNMSSDGTCGFGAGGDQNGVNPGLGGLQDNGGLTVTRALPSNSPAVNAGSNGHCPPIDQRGVARPFGPACDIGAFEYSTGPAPTPTPNPTPTPIPTPTAAPGAFGNVDCMDGISSIDSLKVLRSNAGLGYIQTEPCEDIGLDTTGWNELQGDVDCSDDVTSIDSLKLLRHNAGLSVTQTEPCPNVGS
jgi:CSLREA domain-containing protein